VLSRAGRRSAGLGSDGGARTHAHAGGVRAYGVVCVPKTKRGGVGNGAICSVVVHRWFLTGRRYENSVLFEDISLGRGLKRRSTEYSVHFSTISSFCGLHSLCFFSGIVPQPYATFIIDKSSVLKNQIIIPLRQCLRPDRLRL